MGTRGFNFKSSGPAGPWASKLNPLVPIEKYSVHYRNIIPPHYDTPHIVNSYYFLILFILFLLFVARRCSYEEMVHEDDADLISLTASLTSTRYDLVKSQLAFLTK